MQRIWRKKTFTQNNNNHTKEITFSMCPPLRFWRQLWEFRRYFSFVSLLTHSEDTTVKTIYCLWANGARLTLRWNGTSLLRKCEKSVTWIDMSYRNCAILGCTRKYPIKIFNTRKYPIDNFFWQIYPIPDPNPKFLAIPEPDIPESWKSLPAGPWFWVSGLQTGGAHFAWVAPKKQGLTVAPPLGPIRAELESVIHMC